MAEPIAQLADLTAMKLDHAMAELSASAATIVHLEGLIADLRDRLLHLPGLDAETGQNPALSCGHFDRWQKQAEGQLRHLNIQLALARAKHEEMTSSARLAFGRDSAAKAIQDKTLRAQQDMQRRRVEHQ
ncbi:hypothetical protein [Aliiroseovarius sp. F20344]|uniref:hypothetical protein n=1 Tax=Aliiroseovarius sp. F20344 TaxID=2926414 RepID=UPI001FF34DC5|nr:hypothetical protein [Aliiroseovarius sp. F20344]MCK0141746.1 hypothetical protein [Aliiroseovarius sp. F20344]